MTKYVTLLFAVIVALGANAQTKPRHFVVIAGVSNYKYDDRISDLNFCDDDAYRMYAYYKSEEGGSLPDNQVKILVDEAATKENILQTMNTVFGRAGEEDMITFIFTGHGGQGYLCPHDIWDSSTIITYDEVKSTFKKYKTKYKIAMIDACYSGGIALRPEELPSVENYDADDTQVGLILASRPEQTSQEHFRIRQGVFSFYLIRGLKGRADRDEDQIITLGELFTYVKANVENMTENEQTPYIEGNIDKDTPIGYLK